jgi:hypothetical protein
MEESYISTTTFNEALARLEKKMDLLLVHSTPAVRIVCTLLDYSYDERYDIMYRNAKIENNVVIIKTPTVNVSIIYVDDLYTVDGEIIYEEDRISISGRSFLKLSSVMKVLVRPERRSKRVHFL